MSGRPSRFHGSPFSGETKWISLRHGLQGRFERSKTGLVIGLLALGFACACSTPRGIPEIVYEPLPLIYKDDSTERFANKEDTIFIEVRKKKLSHPIENLAIHYKAIFPGGKIIRPGDEEEYVKLDGRNAYRVTFREKYIRKRKRSPQNFRTEDLPKGWTLSKILDPETGKPVRVIQGPVVPSASMLYLVEGEKYVYYMLLRADGDSIGLGKKRFMEFVHKGIKYL